MKRLVGGKKNDAKSHVDWKVAITCKVAWNEEGGVKAWPGSEKTASCCRRPLPLSLPSPFSRRAIPVKTIPAPPSEVTRDGWQGHV